MGETFSSHPSSAFLFEIELCNNTDGSYNFSHSSGFLHSRKNPQAEAVRFTIGLQASLLNKKKDPILVVGLGWGYIVEELLKLKIKQPLVFIEPISQVYTALRAEGRLAQLKNMGACFYYDDPTKFIQSGTKFELVISPSYRRLFPKLLSELTEFFHSSVSSVDQITAKHFLRQWTRNAFCLVTSQNELCFLSPITDKAHYTKNPAIPAYPVVYCGAGPSLLADLADVPQNAFLIAVDTALGPLLASGRRIGLGICVDSGHATLYHLRAALCWQKNLPLPFPVLTWSGGLNGLHRWFAQVYYYRSTLPVDQILGQGPLQECQEWRNPARNPLGLAAHVAHLMHAQQLYYAGTSFVSQNAYSHERGTGYQEYALDCVHRCFSLDMYQPTGYAHRLTDKAKLAWDGAHDLATEIGLEFLPAKKLRGTSKASSQPLNHELDYFLPSLRISTHSIRMFLRKQVQNIDLAQLESLGLPRQAVTRYMSFL